MSDYKYEIFILNLERVIIETEFVTTRFRIGIRCKTESVYQIQLLNVMILGFPNPIELCL
jgi:hypothetical protein